MQRCRRWSAIRSRQRKQKRARGQDSHVIVTTKDAEAIELASNSGRPRLVFRGITDTERNAGPGMTFAELSGASVPMAEATTPSTQPSKDGVAILPPQPVASWPVQIIRGNAESTIFYEVSTKSGDSTAGASASSSSGRPQEKSQGR